jgi:nucleolar complex protein 3
MTVRLLSTIAPSPPLPAFIMKRSESSFRDIEQQCVRRRRESLIHLIPAQFQPTFRLFFDRYERKLQRSQAKESDEDDAAGPLPVITASGKVSRLERRKAPIATAAAAAAAPVQAAPPLKELTDDQVYLKRQAQAQDDFDRKRSVIAESCGLMVEDPQQHFNRLPQVIALVNDSDLKIAKLAVASLALLFKDIVPGYKIREITKQERETAVSKAVKSVRAFEGCLLHNYQRYLQNVETIARGNVHNKASNKQKLSLRVTCAKALCSLLQPLCHFNFAANLCKAVVSKLTSPYADIANACRECLASFFASNRSHDIILAAVKQIAEGVKSHMQEVEPELLQVLLQLKLVKSSVAVVAHKNAAPAVRSSFASVTHFGSHSACRLCPMTRTWTLRS